LNAASPGSTDITWDFPVLAKYKFLLSRAEPLVELGPSFRLPQELNGGHLSTYGMTGGTGFEVHLLRLRIAPELRFTRWASDSPAGSTRLKPTTGVSDLIYLLTRRPARGPRVYFAWFQTRLSRRGIANRGPRASLRAAARRCSKNAAASWWTAPRSPRLPAGRS
jgi:hypothetical protein